MRTALGRNGKRFAEANFTIAAMRQHHEELYTDLLKSKTRQKNDAPNCLLRVAIVAPSLRYVGGQSVQADLLLANWRNDAAVEAKFIPIDPAFPRALKWVEKVPFLRTFVREPFYIWSLWQGLKDADIAHIFSASYWSFLAGTGTRVDGRAPARNTDVDSLSQRGGARSSAPVSYRAACPRSAQTCLVVPSGYLVDVLREFRITGVGRAQHRGFVAVLISHTPSRFVPTWFVRADFILTMLWTSWCELLPK